MKQLKKALSLSKIQYYETHLSLINCILPKQMTPMEIKVLAAFLSLEGDIAINRFGATGRKIVMNTVNPEKPLSPAGLSNYITSLLDKGFLIKKADVITVLPLVVPEEDEQLYLFKLVNKDHHATTRQQSSHKQENARESAQQQQS